MTTRQRNHPSRDVVYFASDAEAAAISAPPGEAWPAKIVAANPAGTVNLFVFRSNGTSLAKTGVTRGETKGTYSDKGLGPSAP